MGLAVWKKRRCHKTFTDANAGASTVTLIILRIVELKIIYVYNILLVDLFSLSIKIIGGVLILVLHKINSLKYYMSLDILLANASDDFFEIIFNRPYL